MKTYESNPICAAIVGTGFIAQFHARAIHALSGVDLVSICDANLIAAKSFAETWNVAKAYASVDEMLGNEKIDCVHVLVPPDHHYEVSKSVLRTGINVFLEKPMSISVKEAEDISALARQKGLYLGINHNMMFFSAYQQLRRVVRSGVLGPIDNIGINYFSELEQIRFGPFESWMLRSPGNVVLETGPHLFSILLDLVGPPGEVLAVADRQVTLPGGAMIYRRWRVQATSGRTAAFVNMSVGPGFNERTITVHGLYGTATVDLNANTCLVDSRSSLGMDLDRYKRSRSLSSQLRSQARQNLQSYLLARLKLKRGGNPYELSILDSIASYYQTLRRGGPLDLRIDAEFGRNVIDFCATVIRAAGVQPSGRPVAPRVAAQIRPTILVLGGAGFIGRELIRQLVASGHQVRAMIRGSTALLDELDPDQVELVRGDIRREEDLRTAMDGVSYVYHLAVGHAKTWQEYQSNEVDSTRLVGTLCLACGVKRLIFTGTIDSYYAGRKAGLINEQSPLDPYIARRNYYARAKAAAEGILMELHRTHGLPVVIFRPGIVIGAGGNPFHWGVGRFTENICEVWGDGDNVLPFVLVADVAAALVRAIEKEGIEGRTYNLVDAPLLTSNDYLAALQQHGGLRLVIQHRPIWRFYLEDLAKWFVKLAVGHPDRLRVPSYRDWESRTQRGRFSSTLACDELGWKPCGDRNRMIEEGIGGSLEGWRKAIE